MPLGEPEIVLELSVVLKIGFLSWIFHFFPKIEFLIFKTVLIDRSNVVYHANA